MPLIFTIFNKNLVSYTFIGNIIILGFLFINKAYQNKKENLEVKKMKERSRKAIIKIDPILYKRFQEKDANKRMRRKKRREDDVA